jgi:hypothetical protein
MPGESKHRWKRLLKEKIWLSISICAEGKNIYKPYYLDNITSSPIRSCCSGATCITCIVGCIAFHVIGLS